MNRSISKTTSMMVAAAFALSFASPSQAQAQSGLFGAQEVKRWDMCDWERIPEGALARIERRNDYEDILRRMFDFCPDAALALTDRPTAATDGPDNRDDQRGREPDNNNDDDDDDAPGGGGNDGPGDDGPGDDGPGDDGPGGDGPPNGGPPSDGPPANNPPRTG